MLVPGPLARADNEKQTTRITLTSELNVTSGLNYQRFREEILFEFEREVLEEYVLCTRTPALDSFVLLFYTEVDEAN